MSLFEPKLSDFLLDLRRSLAHKGFAKILNISTGMPAVFSNPYASRSQHISSQKIAQLRLKPEVSQPYQKALAFNNGGFKDERKIVQQNFNFCVDLGWANIFVMGRPGSD